ncbi:MAG: M14 family zinc carboxypeptidase, partial [Gemmatimonadales bacterium]
MMRLRTCIAACTLAFGAATAQAQQSPAEIIGIPVGADSTLADWSQIGSYLVHVAETSAWAELDTIGTTTLGKPFLMMTLSSPGNLARSPELKANQRLLADPRVLDESSERRLVAAQPAVVLINNNIHSTEIASSQFSIMLAHRLVSDPEWRALLENVVVLLIPSANPDGLDTVVSWYRTYKGTAYEGGPLPWLYHPYAGHDNN